MVFCVGTAALTSRQFKASDFENVVKLIDEAVNIAAAVKSKTGYVHSCSNFLNYSSLLL